MVPGSTGMDGRRHVARTLALMIARIVWAPIFYDS